MDKSTFQREQIILQARKIVEGARQQHYGSPEENFRRIAALWEAYFMYRKDEQVFRIEPKDVAIMMMLVKVARLMNDPDHWDSVKDIIGYASCYAGFIPEDKAEGCQDEPTKDS